MKYYVVLLMCTEHIFSLILSSKDIDFLSKLIVYEGSINMAYSIFFKKRKVPFAYSCWKTQKTFWWPSLSLFLSFTHTLSLSLSSPFLFSVYLYPSPPPTAARRLRRHADSWWHAAVSWWADAGGISLTFDLCILKFRFWFIAWAKKGIVCLVM